MGWNLGLIYKKAAGIVPGTWTGGGNFLITDVTWAGGNTWLLSILAAASLGARSTDGGITWNSINFTATAGKFSSHMAANGSGVVVAVSGNDNLYFRSTDFGVTWSNVAAPFTAAATDGVTTTRNTRGIEYANGIFMAGAGVWISTSVNGLTWSAPIELSNHILFANTFANALPFYGNGQWHVMLTGGPVGRLLKSADNGATWGSELPLTPGFPFNVQITRMAWSGTKWIGSEAGGASVTADYWTSTDAQNWTAGNLVNNGRGPTHYGGGLYISGKTSGSGLQTQTSPDAITWVSEPSDFDLGNGGLGSHVEDIDYGNGRFVLVGANGKIAVRAV